MIVNTIHGPMDDALLQRSSGLVDNDNERTTWVEYRLGEEIVHRSVHVTLKRAVTAQLLAGALGG